MSDFVDNEAEESEASGYDTDEEEDEEETEQRHVKTKRIKKQPSSDDSDEEEEEEDEEKLRNEMKDLINDEEEEEDDDDDDDDDEDNGNENEEGKKKRRHNDEEELEDDLEEDDYALLEENLGVKVQRKKKFKRVRRLEDEESDTEANNDKEDEREAIANELFDNEDDRGSQINRNERDYQHEEDERYAPLSGSEESDEERDFIVDDNDVPISRPRKKKGYRYNDEALQQAQDIFGVEFDFDDLENYEERDSDEDVADEEYEDETGEGEGESEGRGEGETQRSMLKKKDKRKRKSSRKSIFEVYEPAELEKSYLNEEDKKIINADIPERFKLRKPPITPASEVEIEEEADWIYTHAFTIPTISLQNHDLSSSSFERTPIAGKKAPSAVPKIRETLKFMRNQAREVPFIAFYRKEYVLPDLNINDLWTVYNWDEKWCSLQTKKANLKKLITDMQKFQYDQIMNDPDSPLPEGSRMISQADIERVDNINNFEEFRDCSLHFQLYYGNDIGPMKSAKLNLEREERLKNKLENDEDAERIFIEEEEAIQAKLSSLKLAQRKNNYTICKEAGIIKFTSKFGLTPEQFGENLRDAYQKHEVEQEPTDLNQLAQNFICVKFPNIEAVINAAKFMVAKQISSDPTVRKCIRQAYFERAKVHACPTKKGLKEIDENHPCFTYKYLQNKPIQEFADDEFLQLMIAKNDGLLDVTITIDKNGYTNHGNKKTESSASASLIKFIDEIKPLYQRDEFSNNVQQWNNLRMEALELALVKFLYPTFENELIMKMTKEAQEGIIKTCCKKLYDWLKVGPYRVDSQIVEDEDFDTREGIRILGFAFVPSNDSPAFAALIDGDGEVTDHLRLPHFMLKRNEFATEKEKSLREKDKEKLKQFILHKKPHVICVGAETLVTRQILVDISSIITELSETEQFPIIPVELMDNELSVVFMNSKRAIAEFSEYPPLLRQAVSLARRLQDPLLEWSQLCTPDEELICIKFHSLQDHVPKDVLLNSLQLEFINRVNEIGVDINRALVHPYTSQLLQFVCGLGPRKASALLRNLKKQQTPLLENRTQLIVNCGISDKVFQNCAGFIKIDTAQLSDTGTDTYIEVLDSTRIHPEAYDLARKMAVDALEYDDANEVPSAGALEEIMENPENLKDLDLDAFADQLVKEGCGNKSITLYDIRNELNHPYKDLRDSYNSPTREQIFTLLTKETPKTFFIGKLVLGQVIGISRSKPSPDQLDQANPIRDDTSGFWQCPFCLKNDFPELSDVWNHFDAENCPGQAVGIRVRLDNGILGLIPTKYISDKEVLNPADRVKPGMTIHARITKIIIDKFQVDLTCRTSDLNDRSNHWRPAKDIHYDYEKEDKDLKNEEEKRKKKNRPTYIKRIIVHPSFHNIDFKQAEKKLSEMEQGEAIIRPSSKGKDHLTLSWKVADGIHQHADILEEGKDNAFSLGHQLYINKESYEDLDEIIARFVTPMASFARDLINFKYYKPNPSGKKENLETLLMEEKKKQPNKIPYFISPSKEFPGKFLLSYLPRKKAIHEYTTVTPNGIRYRQNTFRSINSMISWFKEHFRDPAVRSTPISGHISTPMTRSFQVGIAGAAGSAASASVNQAIQRAAASMPSHLFNTLSQVAGQTPTFPSAPGHYDAGRSYSQRPTPVLTPNIHSMMNTPRDYPHTPQQSHWNKLTSMPAPSHSSVPRSNSKTNNDWSRQLNDWSSDHPVMRTPLHATPGASSQMSISPTTSPAVGNQGDQTPLVDEW